MNDTPTIVAVTRSKLGGLLDCGHWVGPGDRIVKVDVGLRGRQTTAKNGRGEWRCEFCAYKAFIVARQPDPAA
jgi:hypothetical protein